MKSSKLIVISVFFLLTSCGVGGENGFSDVSSSGVTGDTTAPAAINDLSASKVSIDSVQLTWTSPGDDADTGTAAIYDIRYSMSSISDADWSSAFRITGEPTPDVAGTDQSMTVTGLAPETTYYFAIKTADEVPNVSDISNVVLAVTDIIEGNTYYLAPDGSDTNDGSMDSPWATIQYAIKNSGPGDIVYLRDGVYVQGAAIRGDRGQGGANGQFWTLKAYPNETPVIKDNLIKIYMTEYVRVEGLTFENGSVGLNSYIKDGWTFPSHTEILDNRITGPQLRYSMIGVIGDDNLIQGNFIIVTGGGDSLDHGIYLMSGSRNIIRNNYISGVRGWGIHIYDEIKNGRSGQITDDIIEGNTITDSRGTSGAIIVATGSNGETLAKNITIRNNIIYANGAKGIEVRSKSQDIYIYNNTLYRNGEDGEGILIATCCGSSGSIDGVTMKNNIIDIGSSTGYHINVGTSASVLSNLVLENNLYWPGPPDLKNITDTSPVVGDPLFVSPSSADFHLRAGSAAIDTGLTLKDVTTDKDGISRPKGSAYDLGAYESY